MRFREVMTEKRCKVCKWLCMYSLWSSKYTLLLKNHRRVPKKDVWSCDKVTELPIRNQGACLFALGWNKDSEMPKEEQPTKDVEIQGAAVGGVSEPMSVEAVKIRRTKSSNWCNTSLTSRLDISVRCRISFVVCFPSKNGASLTRYV